MFSCVTLQVEIFLQPMIFNQKRLLLFMNLLNARWKNNFVGTSGYKVATDH